MNIGDAAGASGISARMIRHDEAIGLIAARRGANQYRGYSEVDVTALRLMRHALAEVKRLALDHVASEHAIKKTGKDQRHG